MTALVGEIPPLCPSRSKGRCSSALAGPEETAVGTADWWPHPTSSNSPTASAGHPASQAFTRFIFSRTPQARKSQGRCQPSLLKLQGLMRPYRIFPCISFASPKQDWLDPDWAIPVIGIGGVVTHSPPIRFWFIGSRLCSTLLSRPRLAASVISPSRFPNPSPPSSWVEDLHLQAVEHVRHTTKTRRGVSPFGCKFLPKSQSTSSWLVSS